MDNADVIRRRDLPHWDVPHAAYFITTCLDGSIPAQGLRDIARYRDSLRQRPRPTQATDEEWVVEEWKLTFARTDKWLDMDPSVRHLADVRLARCVVDAMYHFAGERYDLLAFVVMPSHLHWVFEPRESWVASLPDETDAPTPRERIIHSVNRHTANECNRILDRMGTFWQHESYDHWVRSPEELERIIGYIEANPVKAGLVQSPEQWPFSSAHDRRKFGFEYGQPLVRKPLP